MLLLRAIYCDDITSITSSVFLLISAAGAVRCGLEKLLIINFFINSPVQILWTAGSNNDADGSPCARKSWYERVVRNDGGGVKGLGKNVLILSASSVKLNGVRRTDHVPRSTHAHTRHVHYINIHIHTSKPV